MNLLILGDRKPLNEADHALAALASAGHEITFCYRGPVIAAPFGVPLHEPDPVGQIRHLVEQRSIDAIYFRTDWYDKLYQQHGRRILETSFGVPLIFGCNSHTCHRTPLEELAFTRSDAVVLLNAEAQSWFTLQYGLNKATFLLPSLLLPSSNWYASVPRRAKLSAKDGQKHLVVPVGVLRCGGVPATVDPRVPLEQYVLDRCDVRTVAEQLARRGIVVHLYGTFSNPGAERSYRSLASRFPNLVHVHGARPQAAFVSELSQYDAALLTGFAPHQPVPRAEQMSCPVRLPQVLAAALPTMVAVGTASSFEREIRESGAGFLFDSFDQIVHHLYQAPAMNEAVTAAISSRERFSLEAWVRPFAAFVNDLVRTTRIRCSLRAA